jgi:hypothetical protein
VEGCEERVKHSPPPTTFFSPFVRGRVTWPPPPEKKDTAITLGL